MAGDNIYRSNYFTAEEIDQQLLKVNTSIKNIEVNPNVDDAELDLEDNTEKTSHVVFPAATVERAGVMSAGDKQKLEDIKNYKDELEGAIEGGYEDIAYLVGMRSDGSFVKISPEVLWSGKTKYVSQEEYDDLKKNNELNNNVEYNTFEDE